jgi:hypothetical protein
MANDKSAGVGSEFTIYNIQCTIYKVSRFITSSLRHVITFLSPVCQCQVGCESQQLMM